jgi:hypothetical protein
MGLEGLEALLFVAILKVAGVVVAELLAQAKEMVLVAEVVHMAGAKAGLVVIQPQVAVLYVSCGRATLVVFHQLVLAHLNF